MMPKPPANDQTCLSLLHICKIFLVSALEGGYDLLKVVSRSQIACKSDQLVTFPPALVAGFDTTA
jgi:hypothetical protein